VVAKALEVMGINLNNEQLMQLGREIYENKYKYKFREGFSWDRIHLPSRIFETPSSLGQLDPAYLKEALLYMANKFKG